MKKLAAVFVLSLIASPAFAQVIIDAPTNARMDGLGVANHQIDDDFNVWINPAQVTNYRNAVYGELGEGGASSGSPSPSPGWGGIHTATSYGTWGVYLGRPYHMPLDPYLTGGTGVVANRFDLFYGAEGMPVGGYISYANRSDDATNEDLSEYNIGAGGIFMGGSLEGAVNVDIADYSNSEKENMTGFAVMGRHHLDAGATGVLISSAHVHFNSFGESDDTEMGVSVDTTLNAHPNDQTLVVTGIGIEYASLKDGSDMTDLSVPANIGVEHQTFKRAQTRFGVRKPLYHSFDDGSDTVVFDGAAVVSVGLGVQVTDNLVVDWEVNRDVIFSGTYLISGSNENLGGKVSAAWRFQ